MPVRMGTNIVIGRRRAAQVSGGAVAPWYFNGSALANSLIGLWKLDEASGNALDAIGTNPLTDNATVTSNTGLVYPLAREFTVTNQEYFSRASNATLQVGNIDFWFSAWVYLYAKSAVYPIFSKYRASAGNREFRLEYTNTSDRFNFACSVSGGTPTQLAATTFGSPAINTWYNIVVYHDAANDLMGIKVNNGPFNTAAHVGGVWAGPIDFRVGAADLSNAGAPTAWWNGRINALAFGKGYIPTAQDTAYLYYDIGVGSPTIFDIDNGLFTDCDCIALYDISGDGKMDVVSAQSSGAGKALYWFKQTTPTYWTRTTIDATAADFDGEIEGAAVLELAGKLLVVASGQDNGNLSILTPTTPGSPTGTWTRVELLTGHPWLQSLWAYDLDGDGQLELIFAHEGTSAGTGGIYWLDFTGADPMNPAHWTKYTIIQHPGAFWLAREFIDISGSGRGDLVFSARNNPERNAGTVPGVYWLARPATVTNVWTKTTIDSRVADWHKCEVGNFSGDGNGKDVLAADVNGTFAIGMYRFSTAYSRTDITPVVGTGTWNLRKVPAANGVGTNGRDAFIAPHLSSYLYLYQWSGSAWVATALSFYATQGHPLDNIIQWHDVDGDGKQEAFIADSSDTNSKLAWIKVQ